MEHNIKVTFYLYNYLVDSPQVKSLLIIFEYTKLYNYLVDYPKVKSLVTIFEYTKWRPPSQYLLWV